MSYLITYKSGFTRDTEIVYYMENQAEAEEYAKNHANGWEVESVNKC